MAEPIEGTILRPHRIPGEPETGFAAFLDGVQRSRVLHYLGGIPFVHGTVGAVVRVRRDRRLSTWRHLVERRLYLPFARLPAGFAEDARTHIPLVDSCAADVLDGEAVPSDHPIELLERAVHAVQRDRERAEQSLAEAWCHGPLLIDGGIAGSERVARDHDSVGVVKSHRTLYAEGPALRAVLGLTVGERSTVFRVSFARRTPVASWYLRLRDHAGHDPLWGLVRVEVAEAGNARELGERADRVSRWLLAEVTPLALPDARWDRLVYGVHDCEEFLHAIC
ncbi:MAG: hypothetical protein ACRENI_01555 [Gemmatimonadaceae bacterium]